MENEAMIYRRLEFLESQDNWFNDAKLRKIVVMDEKYKN